MNANWENFLKINNILTDTANSKAIQSSSPEHCCCIFPAIHLGILAVSGKDARPFLQGQISCNIDDITEKKAGIGAFCNVKGRVISTFFIVQQNQQLLLIVPTELLASLQKRLQMYILRADVQLRNKTSELCLLGLQADSEPNFNDLPNSALQTQVLSEGGLVFKYPDGNYWLWLGTDLQAINYWKQMTQQERIVGQTPQSGLIHDINAGIAWLTVETSEQFIPQSLNLDQLGGISFNKGCYTGQEIVARTHYLGKSKYKMIRAHMPLGTPITPGAKLYNLDSDSKQSIGNIVNVLNLADQYQLLVVIKEELVREKNLSLENTPFSIVINP